MQYQSHGHFEIWSEDATVFAELHGCWNQEGGLEFEREFMRVASDMPAQWAHLVYLNDWELCTPEVTEIIMRLVDWCLHRGLARAANIYTPSAIKTGLLNKMIVQQEGNFIRRVFDNPEDGALWLTEEGYPTRTSRAA